MLNNTRLSVPAGSAELLRDLIQERLGVYFADSRLENMLEKLEEPACARHCRSYMDYYYLLKDQARGDGEWGRAVDALSVQETYFWREMSQVDALVNVIAPKWFERNPASKLRIWSAACASGEEPYTIAIALEEAGLGHLPIEIIASDISAAALSKAKRAIFRERSFRSLPPQLRDKYFDRTDAGWHLHPRIQHRVEFRQVNIVSRSDIAPLATSQVIFCRNVFIYFSAQAIQRTVRGFSSFMPPGGYLLIGAAESLVKLTDDFELTEIDDAFAYVRKSLRAEVLSA